MGELSKAFDTLSQPGRDQPPAMRKVGEMLRDGTIPPPEDGEGIHSCSICGATERWVRNPDGKMVVDRIRHDRAVHDGKSQTRELDLRPPQRTADQEED